MKQLFALFLLLAALSTLAQQMPTVKTIDVKTRTETYQSFRYFTDSIVFTIVGKNDTTLVQTFYPNGKTDDIQWRKDSTHWYNSDGFLTRKQYFNFFKPNQDISQDFDEEEQMKRQTITEKNDKRVQQWHDKEMLSEYQLVKRTPSVNYEIWRDGQGTKWASREQIDKGDGKYLCKDSLFFSNGRLHKVGVWKGTQYEKHWLNYNSPRPPCAPSRKGSSRSSGLTTAHPACARRRACTTRSPRRSPNSGAATSSSLQGCWRS